MCVRLCQCIPPAGVDVVPMRLSCAVGVLCRSVDCSAVRRRVKSTSACRKRPIGSLQQLAAILVAVQSCSEYGCSLPHHNTYKVVFAFTCKAIDPDTCACASALVSSDDCLLRTGGGAPLSTQSELYAVICQVLLHQLRMLHGYLHRATCPAVSHRSGLLLMVCRMLSEPSRTSCTGTENPVDLKRRIIPSDGPSLQHFIGTAQQASPPPQAPSVSADNPTSSAAHTTSSTQRVFMETYGCQMNANDSEVVLRILADHQYTVASTQQDADIVLLNTCAIRENAESRIWGRLTQLQDLKRQRCKQERYWPSCRQWTQPYVFP